MELKKLKELSIGQSFRFVNDVHIVLDKHQERGIQIMNLNAGCWRYATGEEDIEPVTLLPIVLEPGDLEVLDHIIKVEGQEESRVSRVTRLLEGSEGAIVAELEYL